MNQSLRMIFGVAAAGCALVCAGCASSDTENGRKDDNAMVLMSEDHSTRSLTAKVGEPFQIRLESNPTTGYTWQMKPDPGFLKETKHSFEQVKQDSDKKLVGAPCVEVFEYKPARAGKTVLVGYYHRSWEKLDAATAKQVVYQITIR